MKQKILARLRYSNSIERMYGRGLMIQLTTQIPVGKHCEKRPSKAFQQALLDLSFSPFTYTDKAVEPFWSASYRNPEDRLQPGNV